MSLPGLGAVGGVLGAIGYALIGPTPELSDGFYAMVGVIVSAISGATATIMVALITTNANRRNKPDDEGDENDDLSTRRRKR